MRKKKGVVAAGHRLTADAAAEILEDGGNAFDAAVAGTLMACVVEAVFASPGGGGFLMARAGKSGRVALYDFFAETPLKPRAASVSFFPVVADFGPATQEFHIGLGASATPGLVPGLFAVHQELCLLPMRRLAEPAVRAARQGFPLSDFQAYLFAVIAPILTASPEAASIFAPEGRLMQASEIFRNEGLAETLEWLAEDGARLFVDGDVGKAIVAQQASLGGHLAYEDLRAYSVVRREPLFWRHRGAVLALNPPPAASGALIAFGLAHLEAQRPEGPPPDSATLFEAMRATNAARDAPGDKLASLVEKGAIASALQQSFAFPAAYRGTTHISIIDEDSNAASVSVSNGEGNGFIVGNHGFMLNNMLGEEDLCPEGLGVWREGSRLSSMMAPTIIVKSDGSVIALGTGGSNRIRTAILQVAVNLLDRGLPLQEAVEAPRLHVERGGKLSFEPGLPEADVVALLEAEPGAHAWPERNLFFGGVHAARASPEGGLEGAGDPRRRGETRVV
jgi:gamma-glutamyltranspeptidase/glutathione hydrolase